MSEREPNIGELMNRQGEIGARIEEGQEVTPEEFDEYLGVSLDINRYLARSTRDKSKQSQYGAEVKRFELATQGGTKSKITFCISEARRFYLYARQKDQRAKTSLNRGELYQQAAEDRIVAANWNKMANRLREPK